MLSYSNRAQGAVQTITCYGLPVLNLNTILKRLSDVSKNIMNDQQTEMNNFDFRANLSSLPLEKIHSLTMRGIEFGLKLASCTRRVSEKRLS